MKTYYSNSNLLVLLVNLEVKCVEAGFVAPEILMTFFTFLEFIFNLCIHFQTIHGIQTAKLMRMTKTKMKIMMMMIAEMSYNVDNLCRRHSCLWVILFYIDSCYAFIIRICLKKWNDLYRKCIIIFLINNKLKVSILAFWVIWSLNHSLRLCNMDIGIITKV